MIELIAFASSEGRELVDAAGLSEYVDTTRIYDVPTEQEAARKMMDEVAKTARLHGFNADISTRVPAVWVYKSTGDGVEIYGFNEP